jgi:hypothetical protein
MNPGSSPNSGGSLMPTHSRQSQVPLHFSWGVDMKANRDQEQGSPGDQETQPSFCNMLYKASLKKHQP